MGAIFEKRGFVIRRLVLREGFKIETVARRFGVHHSVVRRVITADGTKLPKVVSSILDPYKSYIVERLGEHPELTATRLFFEVRERGYPGSAVQVRRYAAKVRTPRARKAFLRVETEPVEQAQVDWGSFGQMLSARAHVRSPRPSRTPT